MPKLNAYGRLLDIRRVESSWVVMIGFAEGKSRPAEGVLIPPHIEESELETYLEDLLHELATAEHPGVTLIR